MLKLKVVTSKTASNIEITTCGHYMKMNGNTKNVMFLH
jgi:hypothetical protein